MKDHYEQCPDYCDGRCRRDDTECSLKLLLDEYDMVLECAFIGITITENRVFKRINSRFAEIFGYAPEELIGKNARIIHPSDDAYSTFGNLVTPVLESDKPYQSEWEYRRKDGSPIWCEIFGRRLGNSVYLWIMSDITERINNKFYLESQVQSRTKELDDKNKTLTDEIEHRKSVEESLHRQKERLHTLINATPDIICFKDAQGRWIEANSRLIQILGFKDKSEWYRKTDLEMVRTRDQKYYDMHMGCVKTDSEVYSKNGMTEVEEYFVHPDDGKLHTYDVLKIPLFHQDGTRKGLVILGRDITDRKEVHTALEKSEQRLHKILESVATGIIVIDSSTHRIVDVNPAGCRIIGRKKEEIIGKLCHNFICPSEEGMCPITDLKQSMDYSERTVLNASGRRIPVIKSAIEVEVNGHMLLIENFIDISEVKRAQEVIQLKDKILSALVEAVNHLLNVNNFKQGVQYALEVMGKAIDADRFYIYKTNIANFKILHNQIFQWSSVESECIVDHPDHQNIDFRALGLERWMSDLSYGRLVTGNISNLSGSEKKYLQDNGTKSIILVPILLDNEFWGFVGFDECDDPKEWSIIDISVLQTVASTLGITIKRLRTNYQTQQSEEKYRSLYEDALIGLYSNNFEDGSVIECNARYAEMLGYVSKEECIADSTALKCYYDIRDYEQIKMKLFEKGILQNNEVRFYKANSNEVIWIRFSARLKRRNGLVMEGIAIDVTAEREAEIRLKENEQKFKAVYNESFNGIILTDSTSFRCIDANKAALSMLQYSKEELRELSIRDLIIGEDFMTKVCDEVKDSSYYTITDVEFVSSNKVTKYGDIYATKITYDRHEAYCFIIQTPQKRDSLRKI